MLFGDTRALRMGLVACVVTLTTWGPSAHAAHRTVQVPVAWVNGQPIQRGTLIELLNLRAAGQQPADGRPLAPVTPEDRQKALDDIVRMELLTQRAQALGLLDTPMAQAELAYERDTVLVRRLMKLMAQETRIDDAALAARHARIQPEHEVTARHILVADEGAARAAIRRLDGGAPFADVARAVSIDAATRDKGGLLGTANASSFVEPFRNAVVALEPGKYTAQPVQTEFGWHVVLLDARKTTLPPPLSEARATLAPQMANEEVDLQVAARRASAVVTVLQPLDDKPLADPTGVVATINGRELTRVRLEQQVRVRNGSADPYTPAPAPANAPVLGRAEVLEELVMLDLLAQVARDRQLDANPSVAAETELQAKSTAGQMYVRHLISTMRIDDAALKALYETDVPRHDFRISQIVVADEAEAKALIARLDKGARFAALARDHSKDDGSRGAGGSLGWVVGNEMPPELGVAVRQLKPGRHAARPVHTDQGWHVLRLDAVRPTASRPPLAEARAWLVPKLMQDQVEAHVAQLKAQADIKRAQ